VRGLRPRGALTNQSTKRQLLKEKQSCPYKNFTSSKTKVIDAQRKATLPPRDLPLNFPLVTRETQLPHQKERERELKEKEL
jgi:hypothetical protein